MPEQSKPAQIILSAGEAKRMGYPKQLLQWQGETLIERAIRTAQEAGVADEIIVVLGAHYEKIQKVIADKEITVVINADWQQGMSSSLRAGLQQMLQQNRVWPGVLVTLVDQPLIEAMHLISLYQIWKDNPHGLAAARYNDQLGVPALFGRSYFEELLSLPGHQGARAILRRDADHAAAIDMPAAAMDVDTPEEWEKVKRGMG